MHRFTLLYIAITLVLLFLCEMSCVGMRQGCIKGNCTNGQGIFTFPDGAKYAGEFWEGTLSGQGTLVLPNGNKYVGEFKDGKYNGQGTFSYPDGRKYVGGFWDGKRYGQGTFTLPDGSVQRGIWKNNKFDKALDKLDTPLP